MKLQEFLDKLTILSRCVHSTTLLISYVDEINTTLKNGKTELYNSLIDNFESILFSMKDRISSPIYERILEVYSEFVETKDEKAPVRIKPPLNCSPKDKQSKLKPKRFTCEECGNSTPNSNCICDGCLASFEECPKCGEKFHLNEIKDSGLCSTCERRLKKESSELKKRQEKEDYEAYTKAFKKHLKDYDSEDEEDYEDEEDGDEENEHKDIYGSDSPEEEDDGSFEDEDEKDDEDSKELNPIINLDKVTIHGLKTRTNKEEETGIQDLSHLGKIPKEIVGMFKPTPPKDPNFRSGTASTVKPAKPKEVVRVRLKK